MSLRATREPQSPFLVVEEGADWGLSPPSPYIARVGCSLAQRLDNGGRVVAHHVQVCAGIAVRLAQGAGVQPGD